MSSKKSNDTSNFKQNIFSGASIHQDSFRSLQADIPISVTRKFRSRISREDGERINQINDQILNDIDKL